MAALVFGAVWPINSATKSARSTSWTCPFESRPSRFYRFCLSFRATVVLPVPGLPRKTEWMLSGSFSSMPFSLRKRDELKVVAVLLNAILYTILKTNQGHSISVITSASVDFALSVRRFCSETTGLLVGASDSFEFIDYAVHDGEVGLRGLNVVVTDIEILTGKQLVLEQDVHVVAALSPGPNDVGTPANG